VERLSSKGSYYKGDTIEFLPVYSTMNNTRYINIGDPELAKVGVDVFLGTSARDVFNIFH
jgi:hypothetical protein